MRIMLFQSEESRDASEKTPTNKKNGSEASRRFLGDTGIAIVVGYIVVKVDGIRSPSPKKVANGFRGYVKPRLVKVAILRM